MVVAGAGDDDGAVQLARDLARQAVGARGRRGRASCDSGTSSTRRSSSCSVRETRAQDVVDRQGVRGAGDGLGGEPVAPVAPIGLAQPDAGASPRAASAPRPPITCWTWLQVRVAHDGVGQAADDVSTASTKRALPPGVRRSLARAWTSIRWSTIGFARADLLAPAIGLVAQDLVGVLPVGQLDDADVVERHPGVVARQLADQLLERRGAERAGLLARGVDVIGERDALRVAGDQRDLLRA